jgi:hypothetical protein
MNTSADTPVDPLVKNYIALCHAQAVGGAVHSDDGEGNMDIVDGEESDVSRHGDPDSPPACGAVGNSACVCGQCDYKHYVALVAKQPEVSGHIFNTHPCNLPLGNVAFKQDAKPTKNPAQASNIFQVVYQSLTSYKIHFVLEWPDFELVSYPSSIPGKDASYVGKLQLQEMIDDGTTSIYQKHEATTLQHTLQRIEEKYFDFLVDKFPDCFCSK